jgi:hypothetical protein
MDVQELKDHFERILAEQRRLYEAQLAGAEREVRTSHEALKERLERMNEFRQQILEERALFVRRDQLSMVQAQLCDRIQHREDHDARLDGKFTALGAAMTIFLVVLELFLKYGVK